MLDISALLNNSINFVLYCTMSRQFRETFVATFLPARCRAAGDGTAGGGEGQAGRGGSSARRRAETRTAASVTGWLKLESVTADLSSPLLVPAKAATGAAEAQSDERGTVNQDGPVTIV